MQQASLTCTLKHQINRHREVSKLNSLVKRSRDHWNGRKVYIRRQRAKQPCYGCKSYYELFLASCKYRVRRPDILLLREHDGNTMDFISLGHSSMWRSMREINGKSQAFKYAGCHSALVIVIRNQLRRLLEWAFAPSISAVSRP